MLTFVLILFASFALTMFSHTADAAIVFSEDFESVDVPPGRIDGWQRVRGVSSQQVVIEDLTANGTKVGFLDPIGGSQSRESFLIVDTGVPIVDASTYTLQFDMFKTTPSFGAYIGDVNYFFGYADGVGINVFGDQGVSEGFHDGKIVFSATLPEDRRNVVDGNLKFAFRVLPNASLSGPSQVQFDNIVISRVAVAVPEPGGTAVLLLLCSSWLLRSRFCMSPIIYEMKNG